MSINSGVPLLRGSSSYARAKALVISILRKNCLCM